MKLLFCNNCQEVFSLTMKEKHCSCGQCGGKYTDKLNATYWGNCYPIGFNNFSFMSACTNQPKEGRGRNFEAFIIPEQCPTIFKGKECPK